MKRLLNNTCQKFIDFLDRDHTCTSTERAQMYYGLQNLLYNIFIIMTIFLSAYILDIPAETFLLFILFNMLRLTAGGYHFNNIMLCLICTALLMVGGGKCVKLLQISTPICILACLPAVLIFWSYAPAGTKKHPYSAECSIRQQKRLRTLSIVLSFAAAAGRPVFRNASLLSMYLTIILLVPILHQKFPDSE